MKRLIEISSRLKTALNTMSHAIVRPIEASRISRPTRKDVERIFQETGEVPSQQLIRAIIQLPREATFVKDLAGVFHLLFHEDTNSMISPSMLRIDHNIECSIHVHNHPSASANPNPDTHMSDLPSLSDWITGNGQNKVNVIISTNDDMSQSSALIIDIANINSIQTHEKATSETVCTSLLEDFIHEYYTGKRVLPGTHTQFKNKPYDERMYYIVDEFNDKLSELSATERYQVLSDMLDFAQSKGVGVRRMSLTTPNEVEAFVTFLKTV